MNEVEGEGGEEEEEEDIQPVEYVYSNNQLFTHEAIKKRVRHHLLEKYSSFENLSLQRALKHEMQRVLEDEYCFIRNKIRRQYKSHRTNYAAQRSKKGVKKPINGYMIYCAEKRQEGMLDKKNWTGKVQDSWRTLTPEEKKRYHDRAEAKQKNQEEPGDDMDDASMVSACETIKTEEKDTESGNGVSSTSTSTTTTFHTKKEEETTAEMEEEKEQDFSSTSDSEEEEDEEEQEQHDQQQQQELLGEKLIYNKQTGRWRVEHTL